MDKLTGLRSLRIHLQLLNRTIVTRVLEPSRPQLSPPAYDEHLRQAGQVALWMGELDDHLYYLPLLHEACRCGLQGTVPEGFEEDGYEGWPEPATPDGPFDPYVALELLLGTDSVFGLLTLSKGLLAYVEQLPEQRRRGTVTQQDGEILMTTGEDGNYRPMTPQEIGRLGDKVILDTLEEFLFVQSYAHDLTQAKALVAERGDLSQICSLLH